MRKLAFAAALLSLAGCATATPPPFDEDGNPRTRPVGAMCDASGLQDRIGRTVTAALGQDMLERSGARQLRWMPPRSAVTMDYREDRLNVAYDDAMTIERITCG